MTDGTGFERTDLWRRSLAPRPDDEDTRARERLRSAFHRMREQAAVIAGEIARDLPDFTVHDVTHLDALWEMADLVLGDRRALSPCEVFVLGGAILCHDLANGVAAFPGGLEQVRDSDVWRDAAASARRRRGLPPGAPIDEAIQREADRWALRMRHAAQAAQLPNEAWTDRRGRTIRLLADDELRDELGPLIGRIAQSHWFDVGDLRRPFEYEIAGPTWCPRSWTIDPLTVACLLRLADAAHIDVRRAPPLLYTLRRPEGVADAHWSFQRRMRRPVRRDDALEYAAATPFPAEERDAWWTAVETITMIDRELRQVDALLAEAGRGRFAARRIASLSIEALRERLPCAGWRPVDTRVRVGDVAAMVERLGGEQLYGRRSWVPLRELIQNAADAVRARRLAEGRPPGWGRIDVRVGREGERRWVEVEDSGIGMSEAVLTGPLLDFGASYWSSPLLREEYPGLLARGFRPDGRFGVGFFAVFIWGRRVTVTTRSCREGSTAVRVLEFDRGVRVPPLLRPGRADEALPDGGTRVRVWFDDDKQTSLVAELAEFLPWLCPTLDVDCWATSGEGEPSRVIRAGDWLEVPTRELLRRSAYAFDARHVGDAPTMQVVRDVETGLPVGRAALSLRGAGILVHDGLRLEQPDERRSGIPFAGVLFGEPVGVARNEGALAVSEPTLQRWLEEQVAAIAGQFDDVLRFRFASVIDPLLGRPLTELPVLWSSRGWTLHQLARLAPLPRVLLLVDGLELICPMGKAFDYPQDMPPHVFVACRPWLLDVDAPGAYPTFAGLLNVVADAWEAPVEAVLVRSQLRVRVGGVVTAPFAGGDPPKLIEDKMQVLVHPSATTDEIRGAFEAMERWRPTGKSEASAMAQMRRLGRVLLDERMKQFASRDPEELDP